MLEDEDGHTTRRVTSTQNYLYSRKFAMDVNANCWMCIKYLNKYWKTFAIRQHSVVLNVACLYAKRIKIMTQSDGLGVQVAMMFQIKRKQSSHKQVKKDVLAEYSEQRSAQRSYTSELSTVRPA